MLERMLKPDTTMKEFHYCYLVNIKKHKWSKTFDVHVPKLMPFIPMGVPIELPYVYGNPFVNELTIPGTTYKNYLTLPIKELEIALNPYHLHRKPWIPVYYYFGHRFTLINVNGEYGDMRIITDY